MRVLVTGGCGYVGARLVGSLQQDGHDVVTLDDRPPGVCSGGSPAFGLEADPRVGLALGHP